MYEMSYEDELDVISDTEEDVEETTEEDLEAAEELNSLELPNDRESLLELRDALEGLKIPEEISAVSEEEPALTLRKEITEEVLESRQRDTEETLENYRENLRNYDVEEDRIEEFVNQERDKIYAEYESLDKGDVSSNIYYMPNDWEEIAKGLKE